MFASLACAASACGWSADPCYALTYDAEKCEEQQGADEGGENVVTLHEFDDGSRTHVAAVGDIMTLGDLVSTSLRNLPRDECKHASTPWPCGRDITNVTSGESCMVCNGTWDEPPYVAPFFVSESDTHRLCNRVNQTQIAYGLATNANEDGTWGCDEISAFPFQADGTSPGSCRPVNILQWSSDGSDTEATLETAKYSGLAGYQCLCDSDADCLAEDVCEAGWVVKNGHPSPSVCVTGATTSDPNGAAPEGPGLYGLASWDEGFTVDNTRVYVSVEVASVFIGAAINDNQRFELTYAAFGLAGSAEITHCGARSLCEHLGFSVGDVLSADLSDLLAVEVEVDVVRVDGSSEVWTVAVE